MGYITSAHVVSVTDYRPSYDLAEDVSISDYNNPHDSMGGE
jgi:hypothetical protein